MSAEPSFTQQFEPRASVLIVSRERPEELARALDSLRLQRYHNFEVVVVGDRPRLADYDLPAEIAAATRYAQCAEPNISRARNIGLAASAGEIIAMTDDDAAPEADWLQELIAPFTDPSVGAVGGYVRNHTGVGFQWMLEVFDENADQIAPPRANGADPIRFEPTPGRYPQTFGVNSAFRRGALVDIGGFDENFHYFLDETDVNLRVAHAGWATVIAPRAEVHHFFAPSAHRCAGRAPRDLFEVGASKAYFIRKHGRFDEREALLNRFADARERSLQNLVGSGRLTQPDLARLIDGLRAGFAAGLERTAKNNQTPLGDSQPPFHRFAPTLAPNRLRVAVAAPRLFSRQSQLLAQKLADLGCETTLFDFAMTAQPLRVNFCGGLWRHAGGVFSRHARASRNVTCTRFSAQEWRRVAARRQFDALLCKSDGASLFGATPIARWRNGAWGAMCVASASSGDQARAREVAALCEATLI